MKYLRHFNENLEYDKSFPNSIVKLIKVYLNDFDVTCEIEKNNNNITFQFYHCFENFLNIYYEVHLNLSIRFEYFYTYIEIWEKLQDLRHYFHDLIKPICYEYDGSNYDDTYEYSIDSYKKDQLLSILTAEEYELRNNQNKYNL